MKPPASPLLSYVRLLEKIDLRQAARTRVGTAGLLAWVEVLEALGWNVALQLPDQAAVLGRRAQAWATARGMAAPAWEQLTARLAATPTATSVVCTPQLRIWAEVEPRGAVRMARRPAKALTRREAEVLTWLQEGKTGPEIAIILGCAQRTVESHVARVYRKRGVHNRAELLFGSRDSQSACQA